MPSFNDDLVSDTPGSGPVSSHEAPLLRQLLGMVIENRAFIVACVSVALGLGLVQARLQTPSFLSETLIQIERTAAPEIMAVVGDSRTYSLSPLAEIEILRSRPLLEEVAQRLSLAVAAEPADDGLIDRYVRLYREMVGSRERFASIPYSVDWNPRVLVAPVRTINVTKVGQDDYAVEAEGKSYEVSSSSQLAIEFEDGGLEVLSIHQWGFPPGEKVALSRVPLELAARSLKQRLGIVEKGGTGILLVRLVDNDRYKVMRILDTLSDAYVRRNIELQSERTQRALSFIEEQMKKTKSDAEAAQGRVNDFLVRQRTVSLDAGSQRLIEGSVDIEKRMSELELRRVELVEVYEPRHPAVEALDRQMAQLRSERARLDAEIARLPDQQQEFLKLQREFQVSDTLYSEFLAKSQEFRILKAGTTGQVRVLEPASTPYEARGVERIRTVLLFLISGLAVAALTILVRRQLDATIKDPGAVEARLGLPVVAVVTLSSAEQGLFRAERSGAGPGRARLLALEHPKDVAVEAMRSLRTSLSFLIGRSENNVLMISGASPGIGKTFISSNVAILFAEAGKKVLVIDCDLRRGRLNQRFGLPRGPGVAEFVADTSMPVEKIVRASTSHPLLSVITSGHYPGNPSELLMTERFSELLGYARLMADIVILDTAPVLAVGDALALAPLAHSVVMVARFGVTELGELDLAVEQVKRAGGKVGGIALNGWKQAASRYSYYGRYSYQGYKYDYQSGKKG